MMMNFKKIDSHMKGAVAKVTEGLTFTHMSSAWLVHATKVQIKSAKVYFVDDNFDLNSLLTASQI